jgi:hypothetical protein
MILAVNTQWTPEFWGLPPNGISVNGHFIVWSYHNSLYEAQKMCNCLQTQGLENFQVDIVDEYDINNYSLCLRKTYLLRLVQRKWKKLYKQWKRQLPKYIIQAQLTGKRVKLVLKQKHSYF